MKKTIGNVLDLGEGIIAHGCNTLGVMEAGFAKQVKMRYPEAFRVYKQWQRDNGLTLGSVSFAQVGPRLWIANVVTQDRIYGAKGECLASLDAIEMGFAEVGRKARELDLHVEFPLIGCGLAGGQWSDIGPRVVLGLGTGIDSRLWRISAFPQPIHTSANSSRRFS